jgi:hypothetical protein
MYDFNVDSISEKIKPIKTPDRGLNLFGTDIIFLDIMHRLV